jgi:hypothetical protein
MIKLKLKLGICMQAYRCTPPQALLVHASPSGCTFSPCAEFASHLDHLTICRPRFDRNGAQPLRTYHAHGYGQSHLTRLHNLLCSHFLPPASDGFRGWPFRLPSFLARWPAREVACPSAAAAYSQISRSNGRHSTRTSFHSRGSHASSIQGTGGQRCHRLGALARSGAMQASQEA